VAPVVQLVANPVSGRTDAVAATERLAGLLSAAGFAPAVLRTQRPGHAGELAAACPNDAAAFVACGGDGTVRECAEGLAGRGVPLAVYPGGTENLFAKWCGWPSRPEAWAAAFAAAGAVTIDLGRATTPGSPPKTFAVLAGVGFDAEVLVRLDRGRRRRISRWTYVIPILQTAAAYRWPPLRVVADGRVVAERAGIVVIANVPRYALGLPVVPDGRADDGLLDATVYDCNGTAQLGAHAVRTALNCHIGTPGVRSVRAERIEVSSTEPAGWELDGDPFGRLPVVFEIVPSALRLRVPPR
jgi:diacylglycerol kinase family enzyme